MGKRYVDHESTLDAPTNKKRKTGSSHQHNANHTDTTTIEYNLNQSETADANTTAVDDAAAAAAAASDVTYSLTTDLVDGVVLTDLCAKKWRCGKPIGKSAAIWTTKTIFIPFMQLKSDKF